MVAERKGAADLNVWKFDKEKALIWLEERVTRVTKVLQRQAIDLTQVYNISYNLFTELPNLSSREL